MSSKVQVVVTFLSMLTPSMTDFSFTYKVSICTQLRKVTQQLLRHLKPPQNMNTVLHIERVFSLHQVVFHQGNYKTQ